MTGSDFRKWRVTPPIITQERLAAASGIAKSTIINYENHRRETLPQTQEVLALVLEKIKEKK